MAVQALYARPSDSILSTATVSLPVGTPNSSYPLVNLYDGRPDKPTKTTGTTATIRAVFGGATIIKGFH